MSARRKGAYHEAALTDQARLGEYSTPQEINKLRDRLLLRACPQFVSVLAPRLIGILLLKVL